ncbi:MAG: hypothetical protein KGL39_27470 [Patescibacteria group bacterium]|nr:hypothetical protein [Patescibacteria group bacterium]
MKFRRQMGFYEARNIMAAIIDEPGILEQNAMDLLGDMMHLCDRTGFSFESILERAREHYAAETQEA